MNDKVISLLGLAERAGKIASGEFAAEKAVKIGKARLIIVAEDASDNTKKKFSDMCKYYQVPFACYSRRNCSVTESERSFAHRLQFLTAVLRKQ